MTDILAAQPSQPAGPVRPSVDSGVPPTHHTLPDDPIKIVLCSCDKLDSLPFPSRRRFSLEQFASALNKLQPSFEYLVVDGKWRFGAYDKTHIYSTALYGEKLKDEIRNRDSCKYAIAITAEELEDAVFNVHREDEGWGVVTASRYTDYLPPGSSLFRYLAYLVLCETLCLVGRYQFEHARPETCLFDMCRNKGDLTKCLSNPNISTECYERLKEAGFREDHLNSVFAILTFCGTSSMPQMIVRGITEPGAGFLLGVAATLGAAIAVTICITLAEVLFGAVALLWVAWLFVLAARGRPRRPKQGGKLGFMRQLALRMSRR